MLRRLFKWTLRLVGLLVVLAVVLLLSRNAILTAVAEREIRAQTGMDVSIGKLSLSMSTPVLDAEKVKLYNAPEFGGTLLLDVPSLHAEYDAAELAQRRLHIKLLRLELAELNVVKNGTGQTNLLELMSKATTAQPGGKGWGKIDFTGIDVMNLSLGKVRYIDLQNKQHSRELDLHLRDQVIEELKTKGDLYSALFLLWLRSGGTSNGVPIVSPPEIISRPKQPSPPKK